MTHTNQASPTENTIDTTYLYRDVHKGIRAELFAVTSQAGRIDPASERHERSSQSTFVP